MALGTIPFTISLLLGFFYFCFFHCWFLCVYFARMVMWLSAMLRADPRPVSTLYKVCHWGIATWQDPTVSHVDWTSLSLTYAYRLSLLVVRVVEKHCDPQSLQRDLQPHAPGALPLAEFLKRLSMRQQGGDTDCLFYKGSIVWFSILEIQSHDNNLNLELVRTC